MGRAVLMACLPWLALLLVSFLAAYLLVRLGGSRPRPGRLRRLHRDQTGAVQSLSFVLVLPFFVMIMLFIVQVSQLMIGTIVVHYAAYAAARSAVVWVPARIAEPEQENCISSCYPDPDAPDQVVPILDPTDENYGPAEGGMTYVVTPGSAKYEKIASAAVLACMPICPSRNLGLQLPPPGGPTAEVLKAVYNAMAPASQQNTAIPKRIRRKLAYALQNTTVVLRFYHKNREPPLVTYFIPPDTGEFYFNQVGWQDPITVTVEHNLALLPGPGRFLPRKVGPASRSGDQLSERIRRQGNVSIYPLRATATLGNEGERPEIPYEESVD